MREPGGGKREARGKGEHQPLELACRDSPDDELPSVTDALDRPVEGCSVTRGPQEVCMDRMQRGAFDGPPCGDEALGEQHAAEDAAFSAAGEAAETVVSHWLEVEAADESVDQTLAGVVHEVSGLPTRRTRL